MITILSEYFSDDITKVQIILSFALSAVATVALYVFRCIGLFVMAKRAKLKHPLFACFPLLWIITVCQLIGSKTKFFGKPFVKMTWLFCLILGLDALVTLVIDFLIYFPLVGNFLMGREIAFNFSISDSTVLAGMTEGLEDYWVSGIYHGADFVNPYGDGLAFVIKLVSVLDTFASLLSLASIFVSVTLYINLFRKYWPQHNVLAGILSTLGIFGPFAFAVRNREPVEYVDYLRSRYQAYGNPYGGQGGYYGNPYAQQRPPEPEHPFEEYAEKGEVDPGDPFEEFNTDKKDE